MITIAAMPLTPKTRKTPCEGFPRESQSFTDLRVLKNGPLGGKGLQLPF